MRCDINNPDRYKYFLGGGFACSIDDLYLPAQGLLCPVCTLVLSCVTSVQPQVRKAREQSFGAIQQRQGDTVSKSITLALMTLALSTKPSVSTSRWRLECPSPFCRHRNHAVLRLLRYSLQTDYLQC